MFDNSDDFYIM